MSTVPRVYARRPHWAAGLGSLIVLGTVLLGLPLAGLWASGRLLAPYLAFPPATHFLIHHSFSWPVFLALCLLAISALAPMIARVLAADVPAVRSRHRFPHWGWAGLGLMSLAWWLAWTRFPAFAAVQRYTFAPLWLGYIVTINALAWRRSGHALLTDRPRFFLALFPLSAVFWWFFEYLNRFVQNWHYVGVGKLGPMSYFISATLAFATVLPAVLSTRDWLATFLRLQTACTGCSTWRPRRPRVLAALLLFIAGSGLGCIGFAPDYLFPLLWVAPLLVVVAWQTLRNQPHVFDGIAHGDWRGVLLPAIAALVCGFLWEMWNEFSLSHWEYTLPFVDRFRIFQMPVLGYLGYLPFGVECVAFVSLFYPLEPARVPLARAIARAA